MFRFLRKYNKWILAVGGTLLLIVFLIPQAIRGLSQAAAVSNAPRAKIADADGAIVDVTDAELRVAQRDLELLQRFGLGVPGIGKIDDPWHWYLLTREAADAGLSGGRPTGLDAQQLANAGFSSGAALDTIGRLGGVTRLVSLYQSAGKFSDRRLRAAAEDWFQGASVRTVIIEAEAEPADFEPTEAQIKAQMEKYIDVRPGEDEDSPFGYKLPDRIKLEWLVVPAASVRSMIEGSDAMSGIELRKHWRQKAGTDDFPVIPDPPPAEVPAIVREDLLDKLTRQKLDEIVRMATSQLRTPVQGLPREGAYFVLPDTWATDRVAFTTLAETLQERFGISLPEYHSSGDHWLDRDDLLDLEGIGAATTDQFPPGTKSIADLVAAAREFGGSANIIVQQDVAAPPLRGEDGTIYLFRILDTDATRPPASVDEVRDEVVADLRRIRHYEQLAAQLPEMEQQAEAQGLVPVALEHDTIVQRAQTVYEYDQSTLQIQELTRQPLVPAPTRLPILGADERVVQAIMDYVRSLPRDMRFEDLSDAQRYFTVPAEHRLAVVVGELVQRIPFTEDLYRQRAERGELQAVLLYEELGDDVKEAFSYDALAERHKFEPLVSKEEQEEDAAAEASGSEGSKGSEDATSGEG